jgi:hypothetical protein
MTRNTDQPIEKPSDRTPTGRATSHLTLREVLATLPASALLPASWVLAQLDAQSSVRTAVDAPDLDVTAFGRLLGRSPATVRAWCERGLVPGAFRLPGDRRPGAWRIPAASLIAFREQQTPRRPAPPTRGADLGAWRRLRPGAAR